MKTTKKITRPFEVKQVSDDGTFEGYGSVFGNIDSHRDIVLPGAFKESLSRHSEKGSMPALLWQHSRSQPVGIWESMKEDEKGLKVKGRLALKTQIGAETYELLKMGAVKGLSIGYSVPKGGLEYNDEENLTLLKTIDLWETSIVTFASNREAEVEHVRSEDLLDPRKLESALRDAGLTATQAKRLMSGGHKALISQRDVDREIAEAAKSLSNTLEGMLCQQN